MNESQIIAWLKTYVFAAPEVQLEMIREMAQRFGRLQTQATQIADSLERVMRERDLAQTEIDRLRQLIYLAHPDDCGCEICTAIRAAEPAPDAIICCICNKPIEGDDLDDRIWLHAKGCKFSETGECDCDLECHASCYAGHEDEYAPPFDDEDEELFDDTGFDDEPGIDELGEDEEEDM